MPKLSELGAEDWARYSGLLDEGLAMPESERARWLQALPPEHAVLGPLLAAALKAEAEVRAAPDPARPRLEGHEEAYLFQAGRRIGPYRLLESLGRGGMGEVWLAERDDETLKRQVALKLPHTWLLTAATRLRLSRERDILAGLSHPNIAQLYDAGLDATGQPWLALERVHGRRIDEHCRHHGLSVGQRLDLFQQVLDAVQSAHARLTVHRDLKPTNILVTDDGVVKLLDFGIAKLVNEEGDGHSTELTRLTGRVATPEYAAPEQLAGHTITVGTDVYALGVVLYELLCGQRPFGGRRGAADPAREFLPLASSRVGADHAAHCGGLSARRLDRALAGDLDAILAKALAPRAAARYSSVERFAEDLRRHRRTEPIEARHITRLERAAKFARRNKLPLAAGAVLTLALLTSSLFLHQALRAREEADHQASMQQAVSEFLIGVLGSGNPFSGQDGKLGVTVREVIDRAAQKTDLFAGQPEQEAAVRLMLARVYIDFGEYEIAQRQIRIAIERAESLGVPAQELINRSRMALVEILAWDWDHAATRAELVRLRALPGLTPEQVLMADHYEAAMYDEGDVDWAPVLARLQALHPRMRQVFAPNDEAYIDYLNDLDQTLFALGPPQHALPVLRETLAIERQYRPGDPLTGQTLGRIGDALVRSGQVAEGLPILAEGFQTLSRGLTVEVMPRPMVAGWLGNAYRAAGRQAEAQPLLAEAWKYVRLWHEDNHPKTWYAGLDLAEWHLANGEPRQALELAELVYTMVRQDPTWLASYRWKVMLPLGRMRAAAGQVPQALEVLREAHVAARAAYGADHWLVGCLAGELAAVLARADDRAGAAALMPEALLAVRRHLLPTDPQRERIESYEKLVGSPGGA